MNVNPFLVSAAALLLASQAAGAADAAAGKAKGAVCFACHGAHGIGTQPLYPNLAGQKAEYLAKSLKGFKSGERKDPTMNAMAAALSDADIDNLAAYFSSLASQ